MKIKDLPYLDKPTLIQLDLDDVQDFVSLYKDFIEDKRFTILAADGGSKVGFIAYYEKDNKEYGYGVHMGFGKALSFLRDKNDGLEENKRWWSIHHYIGTDNPIQRIAEQSLKEVDIAMDEIQSLRERYPDLKDYIDGKLRTILKFSDKPPEGN